jgi:hypothetical protein
MLPALSVRCSNTFFTIFVLSLAFSSKFIVIIEFKPGVVHEKFDLKLFTLLCF